MAYKFYTADLKDKEHRSALTLMTRWFLQELGDYGDCSSKELLIKDMTYYLVKNESVNEFCGMATVNETRRDRVFRINEIYVKPHSRKKGVGALLLNSLKNMACCRGFKSMSLTVKKTNVRAIELYRKCGFKDYLYTMEFKL